MKNVKDFIVQLKSPWDEECIYNLVPVKETYQKNGRLGVMLFDLDEAEEFALLTVNIPNAMTSKENCSFVDTNNCSWAEKFLTENKLASPTKRSACSGYCTYPEYEFDISKLIEEKDLEHYLQKLHQDSDVEM